MSYIGRSPQIGAYSKLDAITTDGSASYTMQLDSANFVPESVNHLIVSVNGVIQAPTDSFTVSGSTITFASSLSVSDTIDFIMALGNVLDIGVPSDSTVSSSKIIDGAITNSKITDGTIANSKLANSSITLNGSSVSLGGSATVGVSAEPYFIATNNTPQTLTNGVTGNIVFQTEVIDSNGCFNNTGGGVTLNGIPTDANSFAPNVSGYYHLGASVHFQTIADGTSIEMMIFKNQGAVIRTMIHSGNSSKDLNPFVSLIIDANGTSDDFQVAVRLDGATDNAYYTSGYVRFWGYRII